MIGAGIKNRWKNRILALSSAANSSENEMMPMW